MRIPEAMQTCLVRSLSRLAVVVPLTFAVIVGAGAAAQARPGMPNLGLGSVGPAVMCVQGALNHLANAGLQNDGIFGERTRTEVINWQNFFGLNPDGIVGPVTGESIKDMFNLKFGYSRWYYYFVDWNGVWYKCQEQMPTQT